MTARTLAVAAFACATLASVTASADDGDSRAPASHVPAPYGPRLGLRAGYAMPIGTAFVNSGALYETIGGYVPIRVDAGYRFANHFYVGADAQMATLVPKACPPGGSCSGSDVRAGVMVAFHALPTHLVDPYLGLGIGYEWLNVSRSVDGATGNIKARGLELIDVELGADFRPTHGLRLGPVLSGTVGRYSRIAINGNPTTDFEASTHVWVMLALRGAYDL